MRATLSAGFTDKTKEFGEALQKLAWSDQAKAEFVLISLPPFYSNLVENLRAKDGYTYGDVFRQIKLYVPGRQRQGTRGKSEGSQENPVVLKTEKKMHNGKRCSYCIGKGWKGLNHEEKECFIKKREEKKGKSSKTEAEKEDDEISTCHTTVKMAGKSKREKEGQFQYDSATSQHTTNRLDLLQDVQNVNITVSAHEKSESLCTKKGTLVIPHNGQTIRFPECLYDKKYSNLVSGQRLVPQKLDAAKKTGTLTQKETGTEYQLEIDAKGGMCIKLDKDEEVKIRKTSGRELAKDIHERYGHISYNTLRTLPEFPKEVQENLRCEACEQGKTTKPPAKQSGQPI